MTMMKKMMGATAVGCILLADEAAARGAGVSKDSNKMEIDFGAVKKPLAHKYLIPIPGPSDSIEFNSDDELALDFMRDGDDVDLTLYQEKGDGTEEAPTTTTAKKLSVKMGAKSRFLREEKRTELPSVKNSLKPKELGNPKKTEGKHILDIDSADFEIESSDEGSDHVKIIFDDDVDLEDEFKALDLEKHRNLTEQPLTFKTSSKKPVKQTSLLKKKLVKSDSDSESEDFVTTIKIMIPEYKEVPDVQEQKTQEEEEWEQYKADREEMKELNRLGKEMRAREEEERKKKEEELGKAFFIKFDFPVENSPDSNKEFDMMKLLGGK